MSVEFLAVSGIIFILVLLIVLFLIPGEKRERRKKKKLPEEISPQQKEWEEKHARLEKHIQSLRQEILVLQKDAKTKENDVLLEQAEIKKLREKLSQEREWHTKGQTMADKKGKEFKDLKEELVKVQESFSQEHAAHLRLGRAFNELKRENESLNEKRRAVEAENDQWKSKNDYQRGEILQLKKDNEQLSKKNDDSRWVAKSEHERVTRLLKEKEKELERVIRESKK
jgi:chromosome segregation ATPase